MRATASLHLAQRPLADLSDGERQRVLLARALAQEPRMILLDEPAAFLDPPARVEMSRLLRRLAHAEGLAILITTHDLDLALTSADQLWLLPPDGGLIAGGPEDLALSGDLARTFVAGASGAAVRFDLEALRFEPDAASAAGGLRAVVHGEGAEASLARSALRRAGCDLVDPSAAGVELEVTAGEGGVWRWRRRSPAGGESERSGTTSQLADVAAIARYARGDAR